GRQRHLRDVQRHRPRRRRTGRAMSRTDPKPASPWDARLRRSRKPGEERLEPTTRRLEPRVRTLQPPAIQISNVRFPPTSGVRTGGSAPFPQIARFVHRAPTVQFASPLLSAVPPLNSPAKDVLQYGYS